jgi:hypothetical protein
MEKTQDGKQPFKNPDDMLIRYAVRVVVMYAVQMIAVN